MAGATQQRGRGPIIQTPSPSSDDGTLADVPLADTPTKREDLPQDYQVPQFSTFVADAGAQQLIE